MNPHGKNEHLKWKIWSYFSLFLQFNKTSYVQILVDVMYNLIVDEKHIILSSYFLQFAERPQKML